MELEMRMARLEASNRRLRNAVRALSLLGVAMVAMGAAAAQSFDSLQARSLQIVDASGKPVVVLGEDKGHGFAVFFDGAGKPKVQMSASDLGGSFALKGRSGADLIVVGPGEKGDGAIVTYTATGLEHVKLGTTYDGAGAVTTYSGDGSRLIQVTANTAGEGLIATFTKEGRVRSSWP